MRRRDFITVVGSAAVWPAAAIAQQNNKKRLVGIITGFNDKEMMPAFAAFRARMQELGWIEGQNIVFDVRTTSGDYEKLDTEAGSLVSASADLIDAVRRARKNQPQGGRKIHSLGIAHIWNQLGAEARQNNRASMACHRMVAGSLFGRHLRHREGSGRGKAQVHPDWCPS